MIPRIKYDGTNGKQYIRHLSRQIVVLELDDAEVDEFVQGLDLPNSSEEKTLKVMYDLKMQKQQQVIRKLLSILESSEPEADRVKRAAAVARDFLLVPEF